MQLNSSEILIRGQFPATTEKRRAKSARTMRNTDDRKGAHRDILLWAALANYGFNQNPKQRPVDKQLHEERRKKTVRDCNFKSIGKID